MTRSDIAVSFSGACKAFGDKEVLHGVDFEIGRGEVVSLIGPSGAGKSTMLRCLTLLETLDAGRIAYGDAVVCEGAEKAVYNKAAMREARMRFGLVFQDYNLFPHRTVLQNVMDAPLIVQHRKEDEVRKEAEDLLGRLGLEGREGAVPCELSGGQQQRVAIAGIVTHEMGFAETVSDRICLLFDGQIVEDGTPHEVMEHPKDPRTRAFLDLACD